MPGNMRFGRVPVSGSDARITNIHCGSVRMRARLQGTFEAMLHILALLYSFATDIMSLILARACCLLHASACIAMQRT